MNYETDLETRPAAPVEICFCEIVLPIPRRWLDEVNRRHINVSAGIQDLVAYGADFIQRPRIRADFPREWRKLESFLSEIPQQGDFVRALIPLRQETRAYLRSAAASVGRTEHQVALAVIARLLWCDAKSHGELPKEITLSVSAAALAALADAGVSVETAISVISPHDEKSCAERVRTWCGRSTRERWQPRKALKWMRAEKRVRTVNLKFDPRRWVFIEKAARGVGITPEDWCLSAIGYRAALEMRKPKG